MTAPKLATLQKTPVLIAGLVAFCWAPSRSP
jgi:hypothetical protein